MEVRLKSIRGKELCLSLPSDARYLVRNFVMLYLFESFKFIDSLIMQAIFKISQIDANILHNS